MVDSPNKKQKTEGSGSLFSAFDHCLFFVANPLQASAWYVTRLGFTPYAYSGLETGSRDLVSHVIRQGTATFEFQSALNPKGNLSDEFGQMLGKHGDFVKDVAFTVTDCASVYQKAIDRGAKSVLAPTKIEDKNGKGYIIKASIHAYHDTIHSFIERKDFHGTHLPNYKASDDNDPLTKLTPPCEIDLIDHVVANQPDLQMIPIVEWYEKVLGFHRFWSVDDKMMHTQYSALRSTVMADESEVIKMPINEPAEGKRKSQIQEYVDYHGGGGIQHIALLTKNIIHTVTQLRKRGLQFLRVPDTYYESLAERLKKSKVNVKEDLKVLQSLSILIDFDDNGYLLQIFTKNVEDRPTLFIEIIQRCGHSGFGAGNFKSLFESIEREQELRGNLTSTDTKVVNGNPYGTN